MLVRYDLNCKIEAERVHAELCYCLVIYSYFDSEYFDVIYDLVIYFAGNIWSSLEDRGWAGGCRTDAGVYFATFPTDKQDNKCFIAIIIIIIIIIIIVTRSSSSSLLQNHHHHHHQFSLKYFTYGWQQFLSVMIQVTYQVVRWSISNWSYHHHRRHKISSQNFSGKETRGNLHLPLSSDDHLLVRRLHSKNAPKKFNPGIAEI